MINLNEKKSINKNENLNNNKITNISISEKVYNNEKIKNDVNDNSKNENNENENKINNNKNLNIEIKKENNIQFNNNQIQNNNNIDGFEILNNNLEINNKSPNKKDSSVQSNVNNFKIQIPKLKIQQNNQNLNNNKFDNDALIVSSTKNFFTNKKHETSREKKKINLMIDYDIDEQFNNSYNYNNDNEIGVTLKELIGSDEEKEKEKKNENNIKDINFTLIKEEDSKKVMNIENVKNTNLIRTQTQNLDIKNINTYTNNFNTLDKTMFNDRILINNDNKNEIKTNINNNNTNYIKNDNNIINNTNINENKNIENNNKLINNINNSKPNNNDIRNQNNKNNNIFDNNSNNNIINNEINNFEIISINNINNNKKISHLNSNIIDNKKNEFNIISSFSKTMTFKNSINNQRMGDLFKLKNDDISNEKQLQKKISKQNYDLYGVVGDSRIFNLFPEGYKPKNDEVFSDIIYYFEDGKKEEKCILIMTPKILFLVDIDNYSIKNNSYKTENIETLLIPKKNISIIAFIFKQKHGDTLILATVRRLGLLYYIKEYIRPNVKITYK